MAAVRAWADLLLRARATRTQLAPPTLSSAGLAYEIQTEVARRRGGFGTWKIAVSAEGDLIFSPILAETIVTSGAELPGAGFHMIGLEGELLFELKGPFPAKSPCLEAAEIRDRIVRVSAAIEIVDTRLAAWRNAPTFAKIADNASSGGLVIGSDIADWRGLDLVEPGFSLVVNGVVEGPSSTNRVGDPITAIGRLLDHARELGIDLPGTVRVSTGSATGLIFAAEGDRAELETRGKTAASVCFGRPAAPFTGA